MSALIAELAIDVLEMATKLNALGMMIFTSFMMPSSWGIVLLSSGLKSFYICVFGSIETQSPIRRPICILEIELLDN